MLGTGGNRKFSQNVIKTAGRALTVSSETKLRRKGNTIKRPIDQDAENEGGVEVAQDQQPK